MAKELLDVVETVAHEKNISQDIIFEAMEAALVMATRKIYGQNFDVRVEIDRKDGNYETFRRWTVVETAEEVKNSDAQIALKDAREEDATLVAGDVIEDGIKSIEFGRIAARAAEMVIFQKIKEAERERTITRFMSTPVRMVHGIIKKANRDFIVLDLGGIEGVMYREDWLPKDIFRSGDRVRACIKDVLRDHRGARLLLTRTSDTMLIELFRQQVPEVSEELIQIMAVARDPGLRAKIAVKTNDRRVDPVGACIGVKGSRIQVITEELGGERIDVVIWDENPGQFLINAMAPAKVLSIVIDEERHKMDVSVSEDQLSLAIGKLGQNVKLAHKLTGWSLNIMSPREASRQREEETKVLLNFFEKHLEIDPEIAQLLVNAGFSSVDEVAHIDLPELSAIEGFDEEIASELQERAKNVLLTEVLTGKSVAPAPDLLNMRGMDAVLAYALAERGIITMEDLAEQAVDDLLGIADLNERRAAELIMTARAPWFAK